jgi:hypothetical protein
MARQAITTALITMLASATGRPIGDLEAPEPAGSAIAPQTPYAVVTPIPGGGLVERDLADAHPQPTVLVYEVLSVGGEENEGPRRDQAEWMADKVRKAILDRASDGSYVNAITPATNPGDVAVKVGLRDLDVQAGVVIEGTLASIPDRYSLTVTRA